MSKNKELLFSLTKKDFVITYYKGSGAGGQHRNKTMSGVRIQHPPSGAMGQSCDTKSQHQNKKLAFQRLTETTQFKMWIQKRVFEITCDQQAIEEKVNKLMSKSNILTEILEDGKWIPAEQDH